MKKRLLLLLLVLIPLVVAFDYRVGESKEVYMFCLNATDGKPLGTTAGLKVRNDTGIFYEVAALPNVDQGVFKHNITNLTKNHCYSFVLNCTSAGTWNVEWGTVCTETNMTSAGVSNVASIGGMVFSSALFMFLSQFFVHLPIITFAMIILSELFLTGALYVVLKWAESSLAAAPIVAIMNFVFYVAVILLGLSVVAFFWFAVVSTIGELFVPKKGFSGGLAR